MAKIGVPIRGQKPPSYGARVVVRVLNGQAIMQKWPRRRGRKRHPTTKAQNEKFAQAQKLAKQANSQDQWMAIEVAKNSPLYPRDLLVSAMYGRLFETLTIDGKEYVSVAVRDDISDDLDKVGGSVVGSILYRAAEGWRGLLPGNDDDVLTSHGEAGPPSWELGGGGGGARYTSNLSFTAADGVNGATKGNPVQMARECTVLELGGYINVIATVDYEGRIYSLDGGNLITGIVATTGVQTGLPVGRQMIMRTLDVPAVLAAGSRYFIAWSAVNQANTFPLGIYGAIAPRFFEGLPEDPLALTGVTNNWMRMLFANPPNGTPVVPQSNGRFVTPMVVKL